MPRAFDRGSFRKSELAPVVKDGVRRINGRQVAAVRAVATQAGLAGPELVAWVVAKCGSLGAVITSLDEIPDGPVMQAVMAGLQSTGEDGK